MGWTVSDGDGGGKEGGSTAERSVVIVVRYGGGSGVGGRDDGCRDGRQRRLSSCLW